MKLKFIGGRVLECMGACMMPLIKLLKIPAIIEPLAGIF